MKIKILPINAFVDTTNLKKCLPILKATFFGLCFLFISGSAFATTYNVNTTADGHSSSGTVNLRGAIEAAENLGTTNGPHIINVPAGTYNLSLGQISFGAHAENISIVGAGASSTIVNMTTTNQDRFIVLNPSSYAVGTIVTSITGIKFTNGLEKTDNYGGGAIQGGCATCTLNLTSCVFEGNSTGTGAGQAGASGGAINFAGGGTLTINQCVFNGNTSPRPSGGASSGFGGAVTYNHYSYADSLGHVVNPNGVLTVTNSTFYNNASGTSGTGTGYGGDGGALTIEGAISVGGQTLVVNVLENNFLNNKALGSGDGTAGAGAKGGAISVSLVGATPVINYNRFSNNTAASGKGNALISYGTVNATNNWWGCNNGPNTAGGCTDNALAVNGTLTSTPYLQLKTTNSNTALCPGGTTGIFEGFTTNSAGTAIAASNLTAFQDSIITFTGVLGTISNQTTINNGGASATYTAGSTAGAGSVYARIDNVPANDALTTVSITVRATTAIGTNPGTSTVCSGSTASLSVAATGSGLTYQWRKGTTNLSNGATGTGSTISGATTATLSISTTGASDAGTNYNVVVTGDCGSAVTSNNGTVVVNIPGTWLGATSAAWSNTANWACGTLPTSGTSVTIPSGTSFSPQIDITTAVANNVTINNGATLTFSGTTNVLSVSGSITNNGTFNPASGKIVFSGTTQTIPATTYKDLQMNGAGNKTLAGAATVNGVLTLTSGLISLGANNLTIANTGSISGSSASSYIVTDAAGSLIQQNIGTGGRTGGISFPVGSSTTSYTPLILTNTGTADSYTVSVLNGVNSKYSTSDVPTGTVQTANAVGKAWLVKEATAGNSNVSLTLQWNAADELAGFTRASCYSSHFYGGYWHPSATTAAGGSNPYTQTITGVTTFSPFGVGSGSSVLPLTVISFTGKISGNSKQLNWTTSSELNVDYFSVERSENGVDFTSIANVTATGNNSAGTNYYSYNDAIGTAPIYYYRLKMMDKDGTFTYSSIVAINTLASSNNYLVKVTPNPFQSQLLINVNAPQDAQLTFELVDMSGKKLMIQSKTVNQGNNVININQLDNITQGTYMLHFFNNSINQTIKLLKIK